MSGLDKNHVHVWWAKELSKLNIPTYWTRIAHLFAYGKQKRSEAFALLMASRKEYNYPMAASMLEKALELFPELDGAKRKLANIYYSQVSTRKHFPCSSRLSLHHCSTRRTR